MVVQQALDTQAYALCHVPLLHISGVQRPSLSKHQNLDIYAD